MRYCRVCKLQFRSSRNQLELHCQSSQHYENVIKQLKADAKLEEDKELSEKQKNGEDNEEKFDEAVEDLETEDSASGRTEDDDKAASTNEENSEGRQSLSGSPIKSYQNDAYNFSSTGKDVPVSWSDATEMELQNGQPEE